MKLSYHPGNSFHFSCRTWVNNMGKQKISKELFDLVEKIGECKTKQEEDEIIRLEIKLLKTSTPDATVGA